MQTAVDSFQQSRRTQTHRADGSGVTQQAAVDEPVQGGSFASPRKAKSREVRLHVKRGGSGFTSNAVATDHIADAACDIETLCLDATAEEAADGQRAAAMTDSSAS